VKRFKSLHWNSPIRIWYEAIRQLKYFQYEFKKRLYLKNGDEAGDANLFDHELDVQELDNVLTLCDAFKLTTVHLSTDHYIIHVNSMAEVLFLRKKQALLNHSFVGLCQEFGMDFFPLEESNGVNSKYIIHWTSEREFVNVRWDVSRCLKEGECIGYLLIGKVVNSALSTHPLQQMEHALRSMPVGLYCKDLSGHYVFANDYEVRLAGYLNVNEMIGIKDENSVWQNEIDFIRASDQRVLTENRSIIFHEQITLHSTKKTKPL